MKKTPAIETADGKLFKTVEEAQHHELILFLTNHFTSDQMPGDREKMAEALLAKKDHIIDLLSMKASSHPAARKANGATRKPRATKSAAPAAGGVAA